MKRRVRTLIVDDSPSMRAVLRTILSSDPDIEVVGVAAEPAKARQMIKDLNPDVLTLDVEMPGMNGIEFLEKIMRLRPMPVVMCSTLTARGADITIEAMRLGAVDCIAKPTGGPAAVLGTAPQLCETVKAAARSTIRPIDHSPRHPSASGPPMALDRVIAIGASTGGVEALFALLSALPAQVPPILIVQHMPGLFTPGFAARLDKLCAMRVVEAKDGDPLQSGTAYIAPGSEAHMTLSGGRNGCLRLVADAPVSGHRPSVDRLFESCAALGSRAIGIILTGMGQDGAEGLFAMRQAGATTFGQSAESCVIYGMPKSALQRGGVEQEIDLAAMPMAIIRACCETMRVN
ncbi:protein-glutamate methylesterase/protein-glutamine glutaminase [Sphingobium subterraneum]|uniref:Protein-glutamate methylesterase/protein-glutamine glutaminase n=1 Tax=Sphingobium subterraneum TaxID=627688 RepID=A0A841J1S2_9SPHN|nr:chemotaxis response regulator protein-glutamate methylesterase [Sphingobium subterraneum]MBB6124302.1 two-component system chemotaxis response regulator CheB [Sphingobium subterraneum]